jgi:phospholipid transport system transporter-binding protein
VSNYELVDLGENHFALRGDVSFRTAEAILRASRRMFEGKDSLDLDLAAVTRTDSAGLALLLEWLRQAAVAGSEIRFSNIPEKIQAIAVTADISELLQQG